MPAVEHSTQPRRWGAWIIATSLAAMGGCGGIESQRLVDYLDELEFDVPLETASYVSLGEFDIPITAERPRLENPLPAQPSGSPLLRMPDAVRMRLQFKLMAETAPPYEKAVLEASEKHRGALNDAVLMVVRTSTIEELADSRLAAVKARLTEITRPLLGEERVRQLVFEDLAANEVKHSKSPADKHGKGHGSEEKDEEHGEAGEHHEAAKKEKGGGHH